MRKLGICLIALSWSFIAEAQDFEHLAPVLTNSNFKDTDLSFCINAIDFHRFKEVGPPIYNNSVQVIDADAPWPPRWYTSVPIYTDSMIRVDSVSGVTRRYFCYDAKVTGPYFAFYKQEVVGKTAFEKDQNGSGYIICDHQMEAVDTIKNTLGRTLYPHDLRINDRKDRMVLIKVDTTLDLRKATGNEADSAIWSMVDYIDILDSNDKSIFLWNPLEHMDPNSFQYKEAIKKTFTSRPGQIDWSHCTSVAWDFDGNIVYSMRFIGIGKISSKDGHVIWHIDWKDIPLIHDNDTVRFYGPHDFEPVKEYPFSNTYSLYSCGRDEWPACGQVIEIDQDNYQARTLQILSPSKKFVGGGQGSVDMENNGDYILNYGIMPENDSTGYRTFMHYGGKDTIYARFQLPAYNYCFRVHKMPPGWKPPRPVITSAGGTLSANGPMRNFTWYLLSGPDNRRITKVGVGKTFHPQHPGIYCALGEYGVGYAVSEAYLY